MTSVSGAPSATARLCGPTPSAKAAWITEICAAPGAARGEAHRMDDADDVDASATTPSTKHASGLADSVSDP